MKNLLFIVLVSFGLVACSSDNGGSRSSCSPNADIFATTVSADEVLANGANGTLVIPAKARELYSNDEQKLVLRSSGKVIELDSADDEAEDDDDTPTTIDFNQMRMISEGESVRFALDSDLSKAAGKNIYRINQSDVLRLFRKELASSDMSNEYMKLCGVDSGDATFKYNDGDSQIEYTINIKMSVRLSQEVLVHYQNQ